jgi:hypothetical protein
VLKILRSGEEVAEGAVQYVSSSQRIRGFDFGHINLEAAAALPS